MNVGPGRRAKFCSWCGSTLAARSEADGTRLACSSEGCGFVFYDNPLPVVAALVELDDEIVLVRQHGWPDKLFGLVTGFLERGESPEAGVLRELREELGLRGDVVSLIGVYPFEVRNEVIVAYHVRAEGTLTLGDEIAATKRVAPDALRAWPFGTGLAVADWLKRRAAAPRDSERSREAFIRALFEKTKVGLNLCRSDGLWIESNQAFLDIIGYSREEADGGLTYWQLTPRKYDADEAAQLEALRTTGRYGPYEKEFIRKDGRLVPVRLNGFFVELGGVKYIWSLVEDLTAQRALERSLEEERVKAIHASKLSTLGEMAASFAHEINNPLCIIDAYAFTLADPAERQDPAYVAEALDAIRSATARAGKIVLGMRKFARESERDPAEPFPVRKLVEESLDLCRAPIHSHGVSLKVEVSTEASVHARAVELEQVLVNLLNNAFDAARASEGKAIRLLTRDEGPSVVIFVEDSGPGVREELREQIFRPFFTTKESGAGTGLGLSISRTIVEAHAGALTYEHDGATHRFAVRLPRVTS
jgi:PAS domain S-box-containing protein